MTHFFLTNRSEEYCQGGGNLIPSRVRVGEARGEDFGVLKSQNPLWGPQMRFVLGKYWSSSFFTSLWTELQARSINLQKWNETNIFPVRTEQASSIKFLLSWLYFEFPDGTSQLIGETRALLSLHTASPSKI